MRKYAGFTMIELLIVISIIGILGSIVYASFDGAREDARNRAMMSELKETQLALEVYKAQFGQYPSSLNDLIPEYISEVPDDDNSFNSNCSIVYQTGTGQAWYKLAAERCFEGASSAAEGIDQDSEFALCPDVPACASTCGTLSGSYTTQAEFYESMAVYSAGGECE